MNNQNTYENIFLRVENDIAWLTIDVKDEAANVINPELISDMSVACDEIKTLDLKGLIIHSGKAGGFIAGADVKKFQGVDDKELALKFIHAGQALCQKIEDLPITTLAMVKGFCMGGGLEIALSCDYIVTDDNPSTKLSLPEVKLGIHPGFGGTVRSIRRVGVLSAMPLMLTGRNLIPHQAKKMGLIDYCVPHRQLATTAIQLILQNPKKKHSSKLSSLLEISPFRKLIANRMRKQVAKKAKQEHYPAPYALINLWEMHGSRSNEMYNAEADSVASLAMTDTARSLVRVFFLQNRLKALGDKSLFSPKHIHVIGGGVMGGDIAAWCAMQGLKVTIQDINSEALGRVIDRATKGFKRRYRKNKIRIMNAQDKLVPDIHGHGIRKADVIIEAIFENLEAKQNIFIDIEQQAKPEAIIATNTSSIPLKEIATAMQQPERLIGLHFFNPVFKMPLLEIIYMPEKTSTETLKLAQSFASHINKLPLPVRSSPGFLINRILMPYILEGVTLFQEGVPVSIIDKAAVEYGMPMGPLELADIVGLDICLSVGKILEKKVGTTLPTSLDDEIKRGHFGKKSGKGFYSWSDKGMKTEIGKNSWNGDIDEIQNRLIEKLVKESQKCLAEGLVTDSDLLDAGVIFGTGFAPFRGGPIHSLKK
ncbi:MAG: 3-hydroxyacyl-CoA dehydrogenase NAD-binding domain-containing protein [Cocleimonas sp.]